MSRIVVVSNRVADLEKTNQSGGLAVAVGEALKEAQGLWMGWDGDIVDDSTTPGIARAEQHGVTKATTPLTEQEYRDYYLGFSNKVLWPAFHYRLDLVVSDSNFVTGYRKVNQRFATQLCQMLQPDDLIWVHDYHLMPLGAELRAQSLANRIGFFLHIPFPPPDIFVAVPEHDWLARSLFSYDVIGFQTAADAANFTRYVVTHLGGEELGGNRVRAFERTSIVDSYPIGIDVESFRAMATTLEADERIERLRRRNIETSLIVGVDRLDYSKGLAERMKAFRLLLESYPENRTKTTFMQIAPPTREEVEAYTDIREDLERLSGAIDGAYANLDWTPVRYIHRPIPRAVLAGIFRGSQVGLVTPLRDGMNLVAKEYVAAQDPENPGVLVLSQFAGAAEEMTEAIMVNPYNIDEMAQAMQRALRMRPDERVDRHRSLLAKIKRNDISTWRQRFLDALTAQPL